ncbi:MAG: cation acetate symporter [Planctomycetota bacterium]|nr:cation acetate symporter [Planctomycetota bacterium]
MPIVVFLLFVSSVLGLSFYLGSKTRSAKGYYAAHGQIHWFVNGVAFAGDYLSAASFLGICGMIALYGYDGFLYSIGYLAGWIVALLVVAEPLKRLGRYTFADALDSRFHSRGIKLTAAISTLVVSVFYLIPQMVGAGALVKPLLGLEHYQGVLIVGAVVTMIVVTAGMVSTSWVQFIKGSLLVVFCTVLTVLILRRGFVADHAHEESASGLGGVSYYPFEENVPFPPGISEITADGVWNFNELKPTGGWSDLPFHRFAQADGRIVTFQLAARLPPPVADMPVTPIESLGYSGTAHVMTTKPDGSVLLDGLPYSATSDPNSRKLLFVGSIHSLPGNQSSTGPLGPISFFTTLADSTIVQWSSKKVDEADGSKTVVYYPRLTKGSDLLVPGASPTFKGVRSEKLADKLDFLSLMLALFCGTASLPHILIRYYTVRDESAARKSTVVGIAVIGFFYVLTLYMGFGAMVSGTLSLTDPQGNMAAPLLAKSFNPLLFALISAIAFTTVLGTVAGLILAASGAVAHDLMENFLKIKMNDHEKVRAGKIVAVVVGVVAMVLGILFKQMNVSFLVGWAFNVAASANLPALVMLLFWRGTTKQGITASIAVGMVASVAWILLSGKVYADVYGLDPKTAWMPFSQPGLVTIPLSFVVLVIVSLMTQRTGTAEAVARQRGTTA